MTKHHVALAIGVAALMSVSAAGQAPLDPATVAFDVISIRQSAKDGKGIYVALLPSGIYTTRNMPVSVLISQAYGYGLTVIGAPDWLDTAQFDISAKAEIPKPGMQQRQLIRSLLADRFKFAAHMETREMPVYALVIARPDREFGPMLRRAQGCDPKTAAEPPRTGPPSPDRLRTCNAMYNQTRQTVGDGDLRSLIINLPRSSIDRPVLDRTGLTGRFDWDLQWDNDPTGASTGVSIFSALQEQLGLKLEPSKGPVEVLVIDHVEMPALD